MLIRGMSLFKKIGANKKIIFAGSLLVTMLCASLFIYARLSKFSSVILVLAVIILSDFISFLTVIQLNIKRFF